MTRNQKIGIGVGAALLLLLGGVAWAHRRRPKATAPLASAGGADEQFDPDSDVNVCVSGATGPTACGDDDDVPNDPLRELWSIVWGSVGEKPPEATPGSPAWSADPPR